VYLKTSNSFSVIHGVQNSPYQGGGKNGGLVLKTVRSASFFAKKPGFGTETVFSNIHITTMTTAPFV
jgi:hypothetical protein